MGVAGQSEVTIGSILGDRLGRLFGFWMKVIF